MILLLTTLALLAPEPKSHALIVTNNSSLELDRPDLHYADDDGVQYAELFGEYFGRDAVHLLTTLDRETLALHPSWATRVHDPTLKNLEATVQQLAAELAEETKAGSETSVYVVFAGHGDVKHGQGFVELRDARLDAAAFERVLVKPLAASHVHVILDSCNSYFMLNPRKPGGKRWEVVAPHAAGLLGREPNVGAIISTSAESLTFEWSELQSGIFSYVVRSGLRGAADVDGDGAITYDELGAFVETAARSIVNDLYRPRVFFAGPHDDRRAPFLVIPKVARRMTLEARGEQRITVRGADGVRLLDVHKEDRQNVVLSLPASEPLTVVEEHVDKDGKVTAVARAIPTDPGDYALASLTNDAGQFEARAGATPFAALFKVPFGPLAFAEASAATNTASVDGEFGVSLQDVARLRDHLATAAELEHDARRDRGLAGVGAAALFTALAPAIANQIKDQNQQHVFYGFAYTGVGLILAGSLLALNVPSRIEDLNDQLVDLPLTDEEERAASVVLIEQRFAAAVAERASMNRFVGIAFIGAGAAFGLVDLVAQSKQTALSGGLVAFALGSACAGAYLLLGFQAPSLRVWQLYQGEDTVAPPGSLPHPHPIDVSASPALLDHGAGLVLSGSFW